jgi:hypothetical protein
MPMGMCTKASGRTTKHMAKASTTILMALGMKASGRRINSMAMGKRLGQIMPAMREITKRARKMALACLCGLMAQLTKVSLSTTIYTGRAYTHGPIADSTMASGLVIKCTAGVSSPGMMGANTMESIMMIKNRDSGFSHGPITESMKASGKMESSMEWGFTSRRRATCGRESGKMENVCAGCPKKSSTHFNE